METLLCQKNGRLGQTAEASLLGMSLAAEDLSACGRTGVYWPLPCNVPAHS